MMKHSRNHLIRAYPYLKLWGKNAYPITGIQSHTFLQTVMKLLK